MDRHGPLAAMLAAIIIGKRLTKSGPYNWLLAVHGVPYFHMKEMHIPDGGTRNGSKRYPLALHGCVILLAKEYPKEPIQITVDRLEKASAKVSVAQEYADSDSGYAGDFDRTVVAPLPKKPSFRKVPAIQAADYIAWISKEPSQHQRLVPTGG